VKRFRFLLLLSLCCLWFAALVNAQDSAPTLVTLPGTIQSVLGCPGDWQPDCEATALAFDETDQKWIGVFTLPAGTYEYKVAINGTWDENYGAGGERNGANIILILEQETRVKFIYDPVTHWITDGVNAIIANVPGSFQSEIGCPGDWQPDCLRSLLQDPDGDGVYEFRTAALPAGVYEAKVAINESWGLNYGADGRRDGANILFSVAEDNSEVLVTYNTADNQISITVGGQAGPAAGNLLFAQAHWVSADTIAWAVARIPGAEYRLYFSAEGALELTNEGITGGDYITLRADRGGLSAEQIARFPHLADYTALKISSDDLARVPDILRGQIAIQSTYNRGIVQDATGIQFPGVLDDVFAYDGDLGIVWDGDTPSLHVWAPTAQNVSLLLFDDSTTEESEILPMNFDAETGVWSIDGAPNWKGRYYLYEVTVYMPSERAVVTNRVTDPYSVSLAMNSTRSQIVDLTEIAALWDEMAVKPALAAPEDIVLYELHVRDFSIFDQTVPAEHRGTFLAFTHSDSDGMRHLSALAQAGLTHIHLLPVFDIATVNEDASQRQEPDYELLLSLPPDSDQQQAIIEPLRELDGFNWGYDPYHYTVPEGSYATDPDGIIRLLEFRQMVEALNSAGLRVVMDVVYNHTNSAGNSDRSVLDRIVPGYYHRLNNQGRVETSTCCPNTATEHRMMEKLMIDSLVTWATVYRVDGFRFDLMGHHMVDNMLRVREALDALTLEEHGVDGSQIYVYGEGWNFGEVADNARGVNATQINLAGTGIGTFNDRLRDAVRGGSPFGGLQEQGFSSGLFNQPNGITPGTEEEQRARLLAFSDQIRVGLAGNLRDYAFVSASGELVTGADIDYNGQPAGYTLDPQEHIVYVSAHDNETLFDAIQMKAPPDAPMALRVRMHNLAMSITALSQGVPFFHAGDDMLRSKSVDRDSYNSGDWFNRLDFTYTWNNWGAGLPPADKNQERYGVVAPLLANPDLRPTRADILNGVDHLREMLAIRSSSPLFRLRTAQDVIDRLTFHNTGADQIPGVIIMALDDTIGENIDPTYAFAVVVFNATPETRSITVDALAGIPLGLHQVQVTSYDPVVREANFDIPSGTFTVPAYTTAVFVTVDGLID
jgi:pullulanase-type alpha-1,6-glucosidase